VFADGLLASLSNDGFVAAAAAHEIYASPRRLGVLIAEVRAQATDRQVLAKGPSIKSALDAEGRPTPALLGFAKKQHVDPAQLERLHDGKNEVFAYRATLRGAVLAEVLQDRIEHALKHLPIPKMMRWADGDAQFVRPVRGLIVLHGDQVLPCTVLGVKAGRLTQGHRFLCQHELSIAHADEYATQLEQQGKVIASFERRLDTIRTQLKRAAGDAQIAADESLYREVAALVEYPAVYAAHFDAAFLDVPQECLMLTMRQNQKYFPLTDASGKLSNRFLLVSNIETEAPQHIIRGNERVLRARLADAKFFFDQDRKHRLETLVPQLAQVVYHHKLGSQLERVERIEKLAGRIAALLQADQTHARRAAHLAKADLLSAMVGEFPELQGLMGMYYARHDGEPEAVARAIDAHYRPRFSGDALPADAIGDCVALADKLETLIGIWGIGLIPTGDKDPFALRRAALGVARILLEKQLPLDLFELLRLTVANFKLKFADSVATDVSAFVLERLKHYLHDQSFEIMEIDAVVGDKSGRLDQIVARLKAIQHFKQLPQAADLAAAHKRVANILRKSAAEKIGAQPRPELMSEPAERALYAALQRIGPQSQQALAHGDFVQALSGLATIRDEVDRFFSDVMVMVEDPELRANRLALLQQLELSMNQVADLSRLAG
jgi:glycyl-tRNA synthetase beta chain